MKTHAPVARLMGFRLERSPMTPLSQHTQVIVYRSPLTHWGSDLGANLRVKPPQHPLA